MSAQTTTIEADSSLTNPLQFLIDHRRTAVAPCTAGRATATGRPCSAARTGSRCPLRDEFLVRKQFLLAITQRYYLNHAAAHAEGDELAHEQQEVRAQGQASLAQAQVQRG